MAGILKTSAGGRHHKDPVDDEVLAVETSATCISMRFSRSNFY